MLKIKSNKMTFVSALICAVLAFVVVDSQNNPSRATLVTYDFAGSVNSFTGGGTTYSSVGIGAGTAFTGQFQYNDAALPISFFDLGGGATASGFPAIALSVNYATSGAGVTVTTASTPDVEISDNFLSNNDLFNLGSDTAASDEISFNNLFDVRIQLKDVTEAVFGSSDLPSTLDLSQFSSASVRVFVQNNGQNQHIMTSDITSLTLVDTGGGGNQVPEPGALALFGVGLVGLGLIRRRRKAA